jgi:hypothetical protein
VMHFGLACRSCYSASRHKSLWQKMIDDTEHVVVFDQAKGEPDMRSYIINIWVSYLFVWLGLLQWFPTLDARDNYNRIKGIINQAVQLLPLKFKSIEVGRKRLAGEISEVGYESLKVKELRSMLKRRQLSTVGSRDALVRRLLADDDSS